MQFYCDVSAEGAVAATYGLIGNDPAFKSAVQTALDWGRFKPAKLDGKPVPVYLAGTVLFFHEGGQPVIVVSLATAERERVGKLANYLQPQLIGGLADRLHHANSSLMWNRPWTGAAEVLFKVNDRGQTDSSSVVSEIPKDSGLGELLPHHHAGCAMDAGVQRRQADGGTDQCGGKFRRILMDPTTNSLWERFQQYFFPTRILISRSTSAGCVFRMISSRR